MTRLPLPLPAIPRQAEIPALQMLLAATLESGTLHALAMMSVKPENVDQMVGPGADNADCELDHGILERLLQVKDALRDDLLLVERLAR